MIPFTVSLKISQVIEHVYTVYADEPYEAESLAIASYESERFVPKGVVISSHTRSVTATQEVTT